MNTLAQLARIKKIRAKKRKILNQYGNQPVKPSFDYDAVSVKELYDTIPSMTRINYGTLFKRKVHKSKYFTSMKKLNKWK